MKQKTITAVLVTALILSGCKSESTSSPSTHSVINGLASQGGAIKGTVTVLQASHSNHTNSLSDESIHPSHLSIGNTFIDVFDSGKFTIKESDQLRYPSLLKIDGVHGIKPASEYSLVLDDTNRQVNLSPLTRLVISRAAKTDASVVFDNFVDYQGELTREAINEAQNELLQVLKPLLIAGNIDEHIDIFTTPYDADFTQLDAVLSTLSVDYQRDKAILHYLPNKAYQVELPYAESWSDRSLIPVDSNQDILQHELRIIHQGRNILEEMILLKDDEAHFNSLLAPSAHWFGSDASQLHSSYFDILPNENDSTLNRYRDIVLLDSQPEKSRYLLGYTTAFEASTQSSVARDQAWFEIIDGELKFLGDNEPFPTSFYAMYKLNTAPAGYNWVPQEAFNWVFETTGFLAMRNCTDELDRGDWQWGSSDFISTLPSVSDVFDGLQYITVTSPTSANIKLDKIFRDPTNKSCHLVDSTNQISGLLDGYPIDIAQNNIKNNSTYTATYVYDSKTINKTIFLTQAPENKEVMSPYIARLDAINGAAPSFFYDWSRTNPFVVEGDIYVYYPSHIGSGTRITINSGQTSVSETLNQDVVRVFHSAFDPYGRVINNYYVAQDSESPLK